MALQQHDPVHRLEQTAELERLATALSISEQYVYEWIVAEGDVSWSGQDPGPLAAAMQAQAIFQRRIGVILCTDTSETQFCLSYRCGDPGAPFHVEERGLRFFNALGQVERVIGIVRTASESESSTFTVAPALGEQPGHISRSALIGVLSHTYQEAVKTGVPSAYFVVGIDDLALFNETYGFEAADELISGVGAVLNGLYRDNVTIGRVSGNKFGVVISPCDRDRLDASIRRVLDAVLNAEFPTRIGKRRATVSIGAVDIPTGARSAIETMSVATEALYEARRNGRGGYRIYQPDREQLTARRQRAATADRVLSALKEDRVATAYQPIVSAQTGTVNRWECLVRLFEADGDIIPAAEFIVVAEELGLVQALDNRVLANAIAMLQTHNDLRLAVNVSSAMTSDRAWMDDYLSAIEQAGAVAPRLCIELTEHSALQDFEQSACFISRLKAMGCQVAIDDFGAGYTSFRNLQRLDVDLVKIDGSFIKGLSEDASNQFFVQKLVELAKHFGLVTTAEFVGHERDAALLRDLGVDQFQGYLVGMPSLQPDWLKAGEKRSVDGAP